MGGPMAKNLLGAGHSVVGYDVQPEALRSFVESGGRGAGSVEEAVRDVEVIVSMLPSGKIARELYLGENGILAHADSSTLLVDCSTIAAADALAMARAAREKGLAMIDAPVSGGVAGAEAATLTFIVGGEKAALTKAQSVLEKMGKNVLHAGGNGAGQVAKICNNMLLAIHMIGTSEALNLGVRHGLDPKVLSEIMKRSSGDNWSLQKYNPYPQVMEGVPAANYYEGGFGVNLMLKDLNLAHSAAVEASAQTPLGEKALTLYREHAKHHGDKDFSSVLEAIKSQPGSLP